MIHLANMLLVLADDAAARDLHRTLQACSYNGPLVSSGAAALDAARMRRPDVVVIGEHPEDMTALELVAALKDDPATRDLPLCLLVRDWRVERLAEFLAAGIDDALPWPVDDAILAQRLRPLVRLSTMRAELALRAASARRLGAPVADTVETEHARPSLLVVGGASDVGLVRSAVEDAMDIQAVETLTAADSALDDAIFDGMVIAASGSAEPALDACVQIRRNPRLFNLPVVLLTEAEALGDPARAYIMGASQVLGRGARRDEIRWAVGATVRRQQTRWAIRRALGRTHAPALASELLPDLYGKAFLHAYLEDRLAAADAQEKHLSVIRFSFGGVAPVEDEFGAAAARHLSQQLGQWLLSLTRAEDMPAALGPADFVVVLPDTPLDEAEVVMHRIAGVIGHTDFAVQDVYAVVQVSPRARAAAARPGDSAANLLARAAADVAEAAV